MHSHVFMISDLPESIIEDMLRMAMIDSVGSVAEREHEQC